jgi:predicted nucleic acid-binding Zn ribbon protein
MTKVWHCEKCGFSPYYLIATMDDEPITMCKCGGHWIFKEPKGVDG